MLFAAQQGDLRTTIDTGDDDDDGDASLPITVCKLVCDVFGCLCVVSESVRLYVVFVNIYMYTF